MPQEQDNLRATCASNQDDYMVWVVKIRFSSIAFKAMWSRKYINAMTKATNVPMATVLYLPLFLSHAWTCWHTCKHYNVHHLSTMSYLIEACITYDSTYSHRQQDMSSSTTPSQAHYAAGILLYSSLCYKRGSSAAYHKDWILFHLGSIR